MDADDLYTTGTFNIVTNNTFDFSGEMHTFNMDINGTLTFSDVTTLYVNGGWDATGGMFTAGNSTVILTSTDTNSIITNNLSFNRLTINDGLIGHWKLDETSGSTAIDSSGYGRDTLHIGTLTSSTTVNGTINFTNPRSLDFDGSNDYLLDGDGINYINGLTALSVAFWAKADAVGVDASLVGGKVSGGDNTFSVRYD